MSERTPLPYQQIDVAQYTTLYAVENQTTKEALRAHPPLCFLLGVVTDEPQTRDVKFDGVERDVYFLTKGSGMYGLTNPDDAMRWKGIFNHIVGTARQVNYMSRVLADLTDEQRQAFAQRGYDIASFDEIDPRLLTDFMLVSHAGRRGSDERKWYRIEDEVHPSTDPGQSSTIYLERVGAPIEIQELMRAEDHTYMQETVRQHDGIAPNIVDNILTYCDWTFSQNPNTLPERFDGLRASKRLPEKILNQLETVGTFFESALIDIVGQDVIDQMKHHHWKDEALIRAGYCAPSGQKVRDVFPDYYESQRYLQKDKLVQPNPALVIAPDAFAFDKMISWFGIQALNSEGRVEDYLFWANFKIEDGGEDVARAACADILVQLNLNEGIEAVIGMPIDLPSYVRGGGYMDEDPLSYGIYIKKDQRHGATGKLMSFMYGIFGIQKSLKEFNKEEIAKLKREYPDQFEAVYQAALESLPRLRSK